MARFKAWNASNSRAIAKFHNAEIGHFGHNTFIHELIRGSLGDPTSSRAATDQATKEKVKDTNIHFYGENYSFEEKAGKISSIKITYDETLSSDSPADEKLMAGKPIEIQKVRDYMLNEEYPELFGDDAYGIAVNDMQMIDFGDDGLSEVVVLFSPHYLQSPTIVIYQIQENGSVKRFREGLAPGPLVKRGEYFLDSHTLGLAVDFSVNAKPSSKEESKNFISKAANDNGFGMVVQYRDFFHADSRSGNGSYIDMTHLEPFSHSKTCAEFEFSKVSMMKVGHRKDNKKTGFIAAVVGRQIYLYEILSIDKDGYLEKELTIKNPDKESEDAPD